MFEEIYGTSPYNSPTDMGVNMAGLCISDDEACREASRQEIIRRYYNTMNRYVREECSIDEVNKQELVMNQAKVVVEDRKCVAAANQKAKEAGINPLIGCEFYVHDGDIHVHDAANNPLYHLILICKDAVGYKNHIKLVSTAWCEGFYYKPRINF